MSCRARGAEEDGGGGGSFSAAPWGRTLSEHVFLRFRRGRKGLGLRKEALQAAPTASALPLLHPPSSLPGFLRQVQHAETPSPSVPCSSNPGLQAPGPDGSCSPSRERMISWVGGVVVSREPDLLSVSLDQILFFSIVLKHPGVLFIVGRGDVGW